MPRTGYILVMHQPAHQIQILTKFPFLDVKPDNVMIDYRYHQAGQLRPERVVLGDLDCSLKLKDDKLLRLPNGIKIGNVMWRSPEAQTGQGIGKPSDVFSYGLVVSELMLSVEVFLLKIVSSIDSACTPSLVWKPCIRISSS